MVAGYHSVVLRLQAGQLPVSYIVPNKPDA